MTSFRQSQKSPSSSTPRFVENLRDVRIKEGETGSLECRVGGFPRPEIQWERNGAMVPKSRNIHLERIGDRCVLRIKSCQSKDEGQYSCIASNIMGTAISRGILHVLSGLKDTPGCRNGFPDVVSRGKEISAGKKGVSAIKNSRVTTTFKIPYSTKFKPDVIRTQKPEYPKVGKDVKTPVLLRNEMPKSSSMSSSRLRSSQKASNFFSANLSKNLVKETLQKLGTKTNINKMKQDIVRHSPLKSSEKLRNSHLMQRMSPEKKLERTNDSKRDKPCVPIRDDKQTSSMKKSCIIKREQKIVDPGTRRMVVNNEHLSKVKKSDLKKDVGKNKPIMRDKVLPQAFKKRNEIQLKASDYQKSDVLPNERRTIMLTRQRKMEKESFEEQSIISARNIATSASEAKRSKETKALKLSDSSRNTEKTNGNLRLFSNVTKDSSRRNKTGSSFKVNFGKKREVENSEEHRIVREFESSRNVAVPSDLKSPMPSTFANDSNMHLKRRNESSLEKQLCDPTSDCRPKILGDSNRSVPVKNSNCSSNLRIDLCATTKLRGDTSSTKISDSRSSAKQINHTVLKRLNDFTEKTVFGKNDNSIKDTCDVDSPVESICESIQKDSTRRAKNGGTVETQDDNLSANQANDEPNERENISGTFQYRNVCPFVQKVVCTIPSHETEMHANSKIRSNDVYNETDKLCDVAVRKNAVDQLESLPTYGGEVQNLRNNELSLRGHGLDAYLKLSAVDTEKSSKGVPELITCGFESQVRSTEDKTLWTKPDITARATLHESSSDAIGPAQSHASFREERDLKPGGKVTERLSLSKELWKKEDTENDAVVTTFPNSLTKKVRGDLESFATETKTACESANQDVIKSPDHAKTHGYLKRDVFNARTCNGNVRLNSDVIEEECDLFVPAIPEAEAEEDTQQVESQEEFPVRIIKGPQSVTVLRGESVTLAVHFQGTPQPTVTWARGGTTLRSDGRVSILAGRDMSVLTVSDVTADDSGKYVVTVENSGGGDSCFASMAVVGIPEPPGGQPTASDVTDHSLVLSWYGSMYDGGSVVTGYVIEMSTLPERRWHRVSSCVNTSHVVQGLSNGQHYVFRVRAENRYGLSQPSRESEAISLEDSSSCEDWELPRSPVKVEAGSLFSEQFELKEEVGKGRFGTVYRCIERTSGRPRAAKVIRCIKAKDKEKVHQEISVMNKLHHPKLMQILAAFESGKNMIMVMEFISGGELFERVIADDFVLTEHDCVLFMRQICDGVSYMHKCSILHLDLKPENILCKTRTCHQIKIIDFGLAREYKPDESLRVLFGTPEFVAPEVINFEPVGPSSDMWSVGVICYVLLSGLSPFMGESDPETFANITRGEMDFDDEAFDTISEDAKNFISLLLVKKQKDRMTAEECLKHLWLASAEWSASDVPLSTEKLKRFIVRRKWQKTGTAIRALGRMVSLSRSSLGSSSGTPSPLGSPKIFRSQSEISRSETTESGFSEIFSDTNSVSELIS